MKENKVLSFFLLSTDVSSACREREPDPKFAMIQNSEGKCTPSRVILHELYES